MPTYDYYCQECENEFEFFQSMKDEPLKTCPQCNAEGVKRLIGSGAGIIFKGSGFYETDYKRNNTNSNSKSTQPASESKSESNSSETKPESKKSDSGKSKTVAA